ncbi:MAG TPA: hypothetical protein IAA29_11490 [Candidatus Paenibacillus intestinavium]|nr:hypothetical protein [Candidatus Paenibacillus intestinavium]
MKSFFKHSIMLIIAFSTMSMMATSAEAGFFDRVQDIYNIPERVEEIQLQYDATKQALEGQIAEQLERLELSQQQAEELLLQQEQLQQINEHYREQNEQYREQTQMLAEENKNLLLTMEKLEQDRKSFIQKLIITISTIIALFILYSLSIRVWRFAVWRKQERNRRRKVLLP